MAEPEAEEEEGREIGREGRVVVVVVGGVREREGGEGAAERFLRWGGM